MSSLLHGVVDHRGLFLIVLVLIQRGKGGGLAGAFGGMGGQSAFGTKAGDLFTKITIGTATLWIILCMVTVKVLGVGGGAVEREDGRCGRDEKPSATAPPSTDKQPAGRPGRRSAARFGTAARQRRRHETVGDKMMNAE